MKHGIRVIDSDTHVNPSMDVLLRYADAALRDRMADLAPYLRKVKVLQCSGRGWPLITAKLPPQVPQRSSPEKRAVRADGLPVSRPCSRPRFRCARGVCLRELPVVVDGGAYPEAANQATGNSLSSSSRQRPLRSTAEALDVTNLPQSRRHHERSGGRLVRNQNSISDVSASKRAAWRVSAAR
jgi:hypothetical protein